MEIAGRMIKAGADPQKICDEVYFNLQPSTMTLIGKVLNSIEFHHEGQICLLTLTKEMLKKANAVDSESDGLVDYTLFNSGVISGALLKEIDGERTKVSFRSKDGINVAEIAARFGGGGHFNASGCTVEKPLEQAKAELVTILSKAIDDQKR
jgi:phosphoesterase RecJ-like protein